MASNSVIRRDQGRKQARSTKEGGKRLARILIACSKLNKESNTKTKGLSENHFTLFKEIPYLFPDFMKGTQVLEVRCYSSLTDVMSTGGGDINTVMDINLDGCPVIAANLADCFAEYRPIRAHVEYIPQYPVEFAAVSSGTTSGSNFHAVLIGAIDYDNGNPFSSSTAALSNDTRRIFPCGEKHSWPVQFDFVPDQEWTPTSTKTTSFAYFKMFSEAAMGCQTSQVFGHLVYWVDFQFRRLKGN